MYGCGRHFASVYYFWTKVDIGEGDQNFTKNADFFMDTLPLETELFPGHQKLH